MRASAVLALALIAASNPAFAAPATSHARRQTAPNAAATAVSTTSSSVPPVDPASAALGIGSLFSIGSDIISGLSSLFGSHSKREELVMLARRAHAGDQSAALNLAALLSPLIIANTAAGRPSAQKREIADFVARQVQNDLASGALSLSSLADIGKIGSDIVSGFEDIFGGNNQNGKRDTSAADASGAIDFGSIFNTALQFLSNLKREDIELMAREPLIPLQGEAQANARLSDLARLGIHLPVARDAGAVPTAASSTTTAKMTLPTTASGALDVGSIIGTALQFLPLFFKREDLELLAREPSSTTTATTALPTDASGALDVGSIIGAALRFLPLVAKREELELMARNPFVIPAGHTTPPLSDLLSQLRAHMFVSEKTGSMNDLD